MPTKNDVGKMKERLARLNERAKSAEAELKGLEEKRKKVQNLIAEEERKKCTHNLCGIGGLVYKYFAIDEVQNFVTKEKEKRFLRDNPSVVISENK